MPCMSKSRLVERMGVSRDSREQEYNKKEPVQTRLDRLF
jgi:hypothetical protein